MLQDFLAVPIQVVVIAAFAIFTLDFYSMLCECWQQAALPSQSMPMSEPTPLVDLELTKDLWVYESASFAKANHQETATAPLAPQLLLPEAIVALQPVMDTRPSEAKPKKEWAIAQAEVASTALAEMTTMRLRKLCTERGVQWRNAHSKGKHLTKNEMIDRLTV